MSLPECLAPLVFQYLSPFDLWNIIRKLNKHWNTKTKDHFRKDELSIGVKLPSGGWLTINPSMTIEDALYFRIHVQSSATWLKIKISRPDSKCKRLQRLVFCELKVGTQAISRGKQKFNAYLLDTEPLAISGMA